MTEHDKKNLFSQMLEECMRPLYRVALRLTRNPADAEDLVADAVTRAWSGFDSLEEKERFRAWMFRILHNCFISTYRKKMSRSDEALMHDLYSGQDDESDVESLLLSQSDSFLNWWANPEKEFANRLLHRDIFNAIDELDEAYRAVIVLVNVEGLSYDDAADVLGVPPGTVRSRMKRGRTLLQKRLWEHAREAGLISKTELQESSQ